MQLAMYDARPGRIRTARPRIRRGRPWPEDLPADPRDPDIVRAKALARARLTGSSRINLGSPSD